jgi:ubiquinone/menaquinone biosynthesis C-methylase UbiE
MAMEGMIARWYSKNTGRVHEQKIIFNKVKSEISPGAHVLEIAPGPGFLSIEFVKAGVYKVTALEISKTFIDIANENAKNAHVNVDFRHGNASEMPFEKINLISSSASPHSRISANRLSRSVRCIGC